MSVKSPARAPEKSSPSLMNTSSMSVPSPGQSKLQAAGSSKKKKGKGKDSGASSDEERWLDAIESGKLEEVSSLYSSNAILL
jgi:INO80 complex subunit B